MLMLLEKKKWVFAICLKEDTSLDFSLLLKKSHYIMLTISKILFYYILLSVMNLHIQK